MDLDPDPQHYLLVFQRMYCSLCSGTSFPATPRNGYYTVQGKIPGSLAYQKKTVFVDTGILLQDTVMMHKVLAVFWIRIHKSEVWIRIRILRSSNKNRKKKTLIPTDSFFLSLKNDVNVPSKANQQKNC